MVLKVGSKNPVLETVKGLLDRAAPLLVDEQCVKELFKLVKEAVEGLFDEEDDDEYEWHESMGINQVGKKGFALLLVNNFLLCNNIQLFPEGEVNSGGYIPRREASRYISTALHQP